VLTIEALGLLLIALYVVDAALVCDPGATVIVGWHRGGTRLRRGVKVPFGRPRSLSCGGLLPPLAPPMIVTGDRLDADLAASLHARMREELRLLRVLTNLLFVAVFVLLPGAVLAPWGPFRPTGVLVLIGVLLLMVAAAAVVAVRRVYPQTESRPNVTATLLSPVSAVRVTDVIVRRLLADWHPVAVARVLCSREDYLSLARSACFSPSGSRAALTRFLRSVGDWGAVQAAPAMKDGCAFYCPKCHAQFVERSIGCPHCCVSLREHPPAPIVAVASLPIEHGTWPVEGRT
jgi:hypothetical protein